MKLPLFTISSSPLRPWLRRFGVMASFAAMTLCLAPAGEPASPAKPAADSAAPLSDVHKGGGLKARLVADVSAIQPGRTFYLGLWIQHDPGYHTYWSNPGIAGVPTLLKPDLPAGFTVGDMIYPPPDKVLMAGLRVHGYERDVLVALPVTAPRDLAATPLTLRTKATWMCCRTTCNPGFAELSLTLPVQPLPASADLNALPPKAAPDSVVNAEWKPKFDELLASQPPAATGWTFSARRNADGKTIDLSAQPPEGLALPEKPQFFSSDNLICSHPDQVWKTDPGPPRAFIVSLSLSDFQPKDTSRLKGLLHSAAGSSLLPGGAGGSYVSLDIPLTGPSGG